MKQSKKKNDQPCSKGAPKKMIFQKTGRAFKSDEMESHVQIGAGAGDQNTRADFRDGFTGFVKRRAPNQVAKIILVDPNPLNIEALY